MKRAFDSCNVAVLAAIAFLAAYPFVYVLTVSMRDGGAAYALVLSDPELWFGYANTLFRTLVGTALTLFMTCLCAYPLARKNLPHPRLFTLLLLFTMLFHGGLVPTYLLYHQLQLLDNRLVYILPGLIGAFNVILVKNFFERLPESLHEAASLDGASEWWILFRVYIPLSKPVLAVIALWTGVWHWNAWLDSMLFVNSGQKQVVQTFLQRVVIESDLSLREASAMTSGLPSDDSIKAAIVVITVLPALIAYPFVQRYFDSGIVLGTRNGD
jgi:putative aldouronate transport system permease protein